MQRKRNPAAVRVLEELQQQERESRGEPPITNELMIETLRNNLQQDAFQRLSPSERIAGAEAAIAAAEKELAELLERTDMTDSDQWSRYESPMARVEIARVCDQIEAAFERRGWVLPELPVVGTLTTGKVGALAQPAADAVLILIDNGFFKFAGVMSWLFRMIAEPGIDPEAILKALADLVGTHAFLGSCLYMNPRTAPPEAAAIIGLLQHAVMVFVIAHEYAHVAAGDVCVIGGEGAEDSGRGRRGRELEADRKAALTAVEVTNLETREQGLGDSGPGIMAPFIFLAGQDILLRAEDAVAGERTVLETNSPDAVPTPFERALALLKMCESDPDLQSEAHHATLARDIYLQLFGLYQRMQPVVVEAREAGVLPDSGDLGTPCAPGYAVHEFILLFWAHVLARFTGASPGDTIREQVRAFSGLAREYRGD